MTPCRRTCQNIVTRAIRAQYTITVVVNCLRGRGGGDEDKEEGALSAALNLQIILEFHRAQHVPSMPHTRCFLRSDSQD